MNLKIEVNDADTLTRIGALSIDAHMAAWAESIWRLCRERAGEKLGGATFGKRIAGGVQRRVSGLGAEIASDGPDGYIGEAVHRGGIFRAKSGKLLAVPVHVLTRKGGRYAGLFPRLFEKKENLPLVLRKSKKGNKLLFSENDPGLGPLFVLKETTKHKPRPWWPEDREVETATKAYFEDNFDSGV